MADKSGVLDICIFFLFGFQAFVIAKNKAQSDLSFSKDNTSNNDSNPSKFSKLNHIPLLASVRIIVLDVCIDVLFELKCVRDIDDKHCKQCSIDQQPKNSWSSPHIIVSR